MLWLLGFATNFRLVCSSQVEIPPPRPAARASILQSLVRGLGASLSTTPGGAANAVSHGHEVSRNATFEFSFAAELAFKPSKDRSILGVVVAIVKCGNP